MAINNLQQAQKNNVKSTEYWEKRLLEMIKLESTNFVFSTLGVKKELPQNEGTTTISMRRYNSLPISSDGTLTKAKLTEGKAPEALKVEAQKVQATINQFGNYIEITDWVDAIHFDDIKKEYQPELARTAAEIKERNIIEAFSEASDYYVGGHAALTEMTAGDVLKLKDCRMVALTMKNYNRQGHIKYGNKPVVVVHPNVMQDLLDDSALLDNILVPGNENSPMKNGTLENYKAYGMNFQETLICPIEKGGSGSNMNVYSSYMLGKNPYVVVSFKGKGLEWKETAFEASKGDPLGQKATIGYKMWTGAKVIDPVAITCIHSASAYDVDVDFSGDSLGRTASQA